MQYGVRCRPYVSSTLLTYDAHGVDVPVLLESLPAIDIEVQLLTIHGRTEPLILHYHAMPLSQRSGPHTVLVRCCLAKLVPHLWGATSAASMPLAISSERLRIAKFGYVGIFSSP